MCRKQWREQWRCLMCSESVTEETTRGKAAGSRDSNVELLMQDRMRNEHIRGTACMLDLLEIKPEEPDWDGLTCSENISEGGWSLQETKGEIYGCSEEDMESVDVEERMQRAGLDGDKWLAVGTAEMTRRGTLGMLGFEVLCECINKQERAHSRLRWRFDPVRNSCCQDLC